MSVWKHLGGEALTLIIHCKGAIQMCVDVDAHSRVAAAARAGVELEETPIELDRVIVLDGAPVLEGADPVEGGLGRRWTPGWFRLRGGVGEARIVAWEKPIEYPLGFFERTGMREAQLDHEAILEGAKEALDAAFPLRRRGRDPADAEFPKGPADLGLAGDAAELLIQGEREPGIGAKNAMAIGVDRTGEAIAAGEAAEEEKVAMGIFLRTEDPVEYPTRSVIDGSVEDQPRSTLLEPGVLTAVHLDEEPRLRHALAPTAMPGGPALAGTADAGLAEAPLDGGA